jgi:hypothetical protein
LEVFEAEIGDSGSTFHGNPEKITSGKPAILMSSFDSAESHRFFAADTFNRTWELLDLAERTPSQDREMLLLAHASLWHWTQRKDCADRQLSVGLWMLARVHAVLGLGDAARHHAAACLAASAGEPPFYLAYAHEAAARAASVSGDEEEKSSHIESAWILATRIEDPGEREMIERDLAELASPT